MATHRGGLIRRRIVGGLECRPPLNEQTAFSQFVRSLPCASKCTVKVALLSKVNETKTHESALKPVRISSKRKRTAPTRPACSPTILPGSALPASRDPSRCSMVHSRVFFNGATKQSNEGPGLRLGKDFHTSLLCFPPEPSL